MTANTRLNLKRNPRMYVLAGSLFALIGLLMLFTPDKLPEHVIFGSLFAIGGLTSLTYINRLSLDETSQELVHQRGLIVPFQNKRLPLRKIRAVKMTVKVVRNGDNSKTNYPVGLDGIKDAVVLNDGNPWFARVVAEQLARLINRPLISRVYGVSSTRKPDITSVGDASAVWIHWGGSRRDSDYLEAAVPYHLLRLGRHAQSLVRD